jgi:hypothetical protein
MAVSPEDWLVVEQVMEEENHTLLQAETTTEPQIQPQLLMIFSHAAKGTTSAATFSVIVNIGGRRGIALVDSGSTDTFIYYTFASKLFCHIKSSTTQTVKVAGGGYLDTPAYINSTPYQIQHEQFSNDFKLLQLKGHAIIFGCDWIKQHNPIGLDLRDNFRNLTI